jgi:hypothetical protein
MAVFGHHTKMNEAGLATHHYISNVFVELGPLKLAVRPAMLPAILVCIGSVIVLYGLSSLKIRD